MARTKYTKKTKNGIEYYFYRLRHKNLRTPKDLYGRTVKELDKKIRDLEYELDHGVNGSKETFESFFYNWLFDVRCVNIKTSTVERYEGIYRNYIKDSDISYIKISDITAMDIQEYYSKLIKKGKSASVVKTINVLVSPCIQYAYNNNFIIKDFSKSIVLPNDSEFNQLNKKSLVTPFTLEEQKVFLQAIKGHELETLFLTALNSGLRQGELLALTWDDINFDERYIQVNKNVRYLSEVINGKRSKYKMVVQTPKTRSSIRKVNIPNFLVKTLKNHKKKQLEYKLQLSNLYKDKNLVFTNAYGDYIFNSGLLKTFKRILKRNNLEDKKFHDLRHTYATRLFELGENPKTVQRLLGHSNISTTLNTYTHVLDSVKEKAVSKLDDLYINMGQN